MLLQPLPFTQQPLPILGVAAIPLAFSWLALASSFSLCFGDLSSLAITIYIFDGNAPYISHTIQVGIKQVKKEHEKTEVGEL